MSVFCCQPARPKPRKRCPVWLIIVSGVLASPDTCTLRWFGATRRFCSQVSFWASSPPNTFSIRLIVQEAAVRNCARAPCPWACSWARLRGSTGGRSSEGLEERGVRSPFDFLPGGLTAAGSLQGRLHAAPTVSFPAATVLTGLGRCFPAPHTFSLQS